MNDLILIAFFFLSLLIFYELIKKLKVFDKKINFVISISLAFLVIYFLSLGNLNIYNLGYFFLGFLILIFGIIIYFALKQ